MRVMSEGKPSFCAPISMTTASPRASNRPPVAWCGKAPFGPEPTIMKIGLAPSASNCAATASATSVSAMPGPSAAKAARMARSLTRAFRLRTAYSPSSLRMRRAPTVSPVKAGDAAGRASSTSRAKSARMVSSSTTDLAPTAPTSASARARAAPGPSASDHSWNARSTCSRAPSALSAGISMASPAALTSSRQGRSSAWGW